MPSTKPEHLMLQPSFEFTLISRVHWLRVPLHLTEGKSTKAEMRWSLKTIPLPRRRGLMFYFAVSR